MIAAAAAEAGIGLRVRRLDLGEAVPDLDDFDGLVVMGGPMGASDDEQHPHLRDERDLLARAVPAGRPVLGVCLGAQLLAAACGGRVFPGQAGAEIGLGIVELTDQGRADPVFGPAGWVLPVLHWHGDTYARPGGATRLAASSRYPEQAFRVGERAYGLQFHVEIDEPAAAAMEPHLPAGVRLDRRHLALVTRTGRGVLRRFFTAAREGVGEKSVG